MTSEHSYQTFGLNAPAGRQQGPLSKLIAFVLSAGLLILAFMFSLVALAVVAVAGLILGGWLWWRTRKLRQEIARQRTAQWTASADDNESRTTPDHGATVIDGVATRVPDDSASAPGAR